MEQSVIPTALFSSLIAVVSLLWSGCTLHPDFVRSTQAAFRRTTGTTAPVITDADIASLPAPVQRYMRYSGAVGHPRPHNFRLEFDAEMRKNADASPMTATSVQYNFFAEGSRYFFMKARMKGIPARVLHRYENASARMTVIAAHLFTVTDISGDTLSRAETVTILNDICFFAPGALLGLQAQWTAIDDSSAGITFTNGPYTVSATLRFNTEGALVDFISHDRAALQDDGSLKMAPWSTPARDYRDVEGRRVAGFAEAVYHYPEGDLVYGKFNLRSIRWDVDGMDEEDE